MIDTRRFFLKSLAGTSGSFLLFQSCPPIPTPRVRTPITPPPPAEKQDDGGPSGGPTINQHARLRAQEKQFRETIDKLFTDVSGLKNEIDAIHTSDIFSVDIFRQTKEIEKLAKELKNYAKS